MAQGVTPAGINPNSRINPTTERKLMAKVVDNVLSSRTYMSRLFGQGGPFNGKTYDIPVKITDSGLGQFFTGLELLNSSASDTLIELSFAHTAFAQPVVNIMLESFANSGPEQTIDLDVFKLEEAVAESVQKLGTALYQYGQSNQPAGLEYHVDDGSNSPTYGGQARATYTALNSTVTPAATNKLTLAQMGTLDDTISASGMENESPNIGVTTKTVWGLYEQLLQPQVRNNYSMMGSDVLPLRGDQIVPRKDAGATGGFTALSYRGFPIIKDDACTSGVLYFLNERYIRWMGRDIVPAALAGVLERVRIGARRTIEGVGAETPPTDYGWFFQKRQVMPNQAGMIGRFYVIGQVCGWQPRRQGKLTGITGI